MWSTSGEADPQAKNELLGNARALLFPIQWEEPFGLVMVEAMACGTPVLAFPTGSVPEVIEDGVNGRICEDLDEMSEWIRNPGGRSARLPAPCRTPLLARRDGRRLRGPVSKPCGRLTGTASTFRVRVSMPDVIKVEDKYYILATATRAMGTHAVLKDGDTFAVFDAVGDIFGEGLGEQGLYHDGTRFLSMLELRLNSDRPLLLSSRSSPDNLQFGADLTNRDCFLDGHVTLPQGSGPRLSIPIPVERRDARARAPHQLQSTSDQADPGL